jgi:hypothetical protein
MRRLPFRWADDIDERLLRATPLMRIFLSHSHQQRAEAASLATRLRVENHRPFYDASDLERGAGYDGPIREEIAACDLFLFLLSPDAVRKGSYALAELEMAQRRWPDPSRRVLPVMVLSTPVNLIPPYLSALYILEPKGEMVAEVLHEVARRARQRRARLALLGGIGAVLLGGALAAGAWMRVGAPTTQRRSHDGDVVAVRLVPRDQSARPQQPSVPPRQPALAPRGGPHRDEASSGGKREVPTRRELARLFPGTRACRPTIQDDGAADSVWLVCRCPAGSDLDPPASLEIRRNGWRTQRWAHAATRAREAWEQKPCP